MLKISFSDLVAEAQFSPQILATLQFVADSVISTDSRIKREFSSARGTDQGTVMSANIYNYECENFSSVVKQNENRSNAESNDDKFIGDDALLAARLFLLYNGENRVYTVTVAGSNHQNTYTSNTKRDAAVADLENSKRKT